VLPYRSNIPAISDFVFDVADEGFAKRAKEKGSGIVIGGENYGQGSSREHAAICPMFLGVKAVLAKSFERIHAANLINFGILPLTFANDGDYGAIGAGDRLEIKDIKAALRAGRGLALHDATNGKTIALKCALSVRQMDILLAGGMLNYMKARST
jgi:aconitate hydratase